jgi:multisubunit Na+/H+ antiporter MnhF subunit
MASVLLGGTTGVALLLILAAIEGSGSTLDTALVLAVLAPVLTVAFVAARRRPGTGEADHG